MKKTLLLAAIGVVCHSYGQQQLENPGFENWENPIGPVEEPVDWSSLQTGGGLATSGPTVIFKSTDAHNGSYSLKLENSLALGVVPTNGICTNGKVQAPTTNAEDGYVETVTSDADFNTPFTSRPDSLVGYYMYTSVSGDKGKIEVTVHSGEYANPDNGSYQGNLSGNLIGKARFETPASNVTGWTRFSVPFVYQSGSTPAYVLSVVTSGDSLSPQIGSEMWIDDLFLVYNPQGIEEFNVENLSVVSAEEGLKVYFESVDPTEEFRIFGLNGQLLEEGKLNSAEDNLIEHQLNPGMYIFRLGNNQGTSQKILIQ